MSLLSIAGAAYYVNDLFSVCKESMLLSSILLDLSLSSFGQMDGFIHLVVAIRQGIKKEREE